MPKSRRISSASRGSALTEVVILLPVFLLVIYASLYLCDLGILKLTAQEIVRYGAWSLSVRPLSDYENFNHADTFTTSSVNAVSDINQVYETLYSSGVTMAGRHVNTTLNDFSNAPTPALNWNTQSAPNSAWTHILNVLQLAGGTSLVSTMMTPLGLDANGLVTATASVLMTPLSQPTQQENMQVLAQSTNLAATTPPADGTALFDTDGTAMHTTLLVDSWRLTQGFSAHPMTQLTTNRHYANVVKRVDHNIVSALPLGPLWRGLSAGVEKLPDAVNALIGWPLELPETHLIARPYTATRSARPAYNGTAVSGQVNIIKETGGATQFKQHQEVKLFETGAMYNDPSDVQSSPYVNAINSRGANFMGCSQSQDEGCVSR